MALGLELGKGAFKMILKFEDISPIEIYKVMSQAVIPRPIAWIVTEDEGVINAAPFSYFTPLSSNPPTMIVSVGHKADGTPKDTLHNVRKHKCCTICIPDPSQLKPMHQSAASLDHSESECQLYAIKTQKILDDFPPMIEGIQCAFFCTLYQEIDLKGSKTIPLIVEIKQTFLSDANVLDADKLYLNIDPIARIGKEYASIETKLPIPNCDETS